MFLLRMFKNTQNTFYFPSWLKEKQSYYHHFTSQSPRDLGLRQLGSQNQLSLCGCLPCGTRAPKRCFMLPHVFLLLGRKTMLSLCNSLHLPKMCQSSPRSQSLSCADTSLQNVVAVQDGLGMCPHSCVQ